MADEEQVGRLLQGVGAWNAWRSENRDIRPDLVRVNLNRADLRRADLNRANLCEANLYKANLSKANLAMADLGGALLSMSILGGARLGQANLREANLTKASLIGADLREADLREADLREADLIGADLTGANLKLANLSRASLFAANLTRADLTGADLRVTNLSWADLTGANLSNATLVETNLANANLTGCYIYGISAWGLKLEGAKQQDLIISAPHEPSITVDNMEIAEFIYLMLHNQKIRDVIDSITSKAVLILGRCTPGRKKVLDALRDELRQRNYLPILFDFDKPASQDLTATVSTLAHMACFIVADLTDLSSIAYELATVVRTIPVPVILLSRQSEFAMFRDLQWRFRWVLAPHCYDDLDQLIEDLKEKVIDPAEAKVLELRGTKPE